MPSGGCTCNCQSSCRGGAGAVVGVDVGDAGGVVTPLLRIPSGFHIVCSLHFADCAVWRTCHTCYAMGPENHPHCAQSAWLAYVQRSVGSHVFICDPSRTGEHTCLAPAVLSITLKHPAGIFQGGSRGRLALLFCNNTIIACRLIPSHWTSHIAFNPALKAQCQVRCHTFYHNV